MSKVVELFDNKWLSVLEKHMDNGGRYVYSTAKWCNSQGVAILPFRMKLKLVGWNYYEPEFLGRYEICPAHSDLVELCSITGGMDKPYEDTITTAHRELIEEGGYDVPIENIVSLGTVRPSKSSDSLMHLFAVNLDEGAKEVTAVGDGTLGEEGSYCSWITEQQLVEAKDPLLHTMLLRATFAGLIKR